jgi:hypothetical protein
VVGLAHTICPGLVGDQACSETDERPEPKPHYPTHSEWETRTLTSDMKMELD